MRIGMLVLPLVAATIGATEAHAVVQNFGSVRDNTIYSEGTFSNGAGIYMFAGANAQNNLRRALVTFDVSAIPAGSTINSVSLRLHMSRSLGGPYFISTHRLLADWGSAGSDATANEGMGAPAQTNDATWANAFHATVPWSTPGGDFVPAASDAQLVEGVNFYTWSGDGMIADVQAWVNGTASNFGWALVGQEDTSGSAKRFDTRENSNTSFRPQLTIDYTPVPAPGAAALSLVGGAFAARRRRR